VRAAFEEKTQCLVEEYDGFEVNGEHENGALTLGENMGAPPPPPPLKENCQ
jgi:predicted metalloendopeptidase